MTQAAPDASDYQAQATGTKRRLERATARNERLKAAIRAISSAWQGSRTSRLADRDIRDAIEAAEGLVAEIEGEEGR
jgi:chemotaxis regulatin CheY-phosphate phosphatase CheZ